MWGTSDPWSHVAAQSKERTQWDVQPHHNPLNRFKTTRQTTHQAHDAGVALDPTARRPATPSLRLWSKPDSVARRRKRQLGTSNRGNHGDYLRMKRNILVGEGSHYSLGLQEG